MNAYQESSAGELRAVTCPICTNGEVIADVGAGTRNSHFVAAWIDNMHARVDFHGGNAPKTTDYAADHCHGARGSTVGFVCSYEQCRHVVEFSFTFHKGDVLVHWRAIDPLDAIPEMPRD